MSYSPFTGTTESEPHSSQRNFGMTSIVDEYGLAKKTGCEIGSGHFIIPFLHNSDGIFRKKFCDHPGDGRKRVTQSY